jgi:polar amino acid transport system substrate-binding protein
MLCLRDLTKRHDKITGKFILDTSIPDAVSDLEWLDPPLHVDIQYLVFSKMAGDYAARLVAFNRGLAEIKADGTLKAIMAKHGF